MPRYKYLREDGEYIIINHSVDELPLEEDPETGQEIERVFNAQNVLFKFKGAGFHTTDYNDHKPKEDDVIENKKDPNKDTYNYK